LRLRSFIPVWHIMVVLSEHVVDPATSAPLTQLDTSPRYLLYLVRIAVYSRQHSISLKARFDPIQLKNAFSCPPIIIGHWVDPGRKSSTNTHPIELVIFARAASPTWDSQIQAVVIRNDDNEVGCIHIRTAFRAKLLNKVSHWRNTRYLRESTY
jgi:hypothetical protein